jgi:acetyl-CoA C-acetyltransferase
VTIDDRTPVLVGSGAASQRLDEPGSGREALGLMVAAAEAAGRDAGAPDLLRRVGLVLVPQGTWHYHDAGRLVADRIGASGATTLYALLGVLQTTLFGTAARAIASGDLDAALVVGGEAKWRSSRAHRAGLEASSTDDAGAVPSQTVGPEDPIISRAEIEAGLVAPVSQYALLENARRHADGQKPDDHADRVARLWARFSAVAADNPRAWNRRPVSAEVIATPGPENRPLALPYNRWHVSQWNVDQAGAQLLCSVATARALGVTEDRWVFPHAVVDANHMVPVSERAVLDRSPGFAVAGREAFALAGTGPDELEHVDLYSCFPIAVRAQARELGLAEDRQLTVTGGMTFAGGPLNNYVLQSAHTMVDRLRHDPDALGLLTAVSGMLTKQGVSVWGARPPANGFRDADVSAEVARATPRRPVTARWRGRAVLASYTVVAGEAATAVALADVPGDGDTGPAGRALATSTDPVLVTAMGQGEWCGRAVDLDGAGGFTPA